MEQGTSASLWYWSVNSEVETLGGSVQMGNKTKLQSAMFEGFHSWPICKLSSLIVLWTRRHKWLLGDSVGMEWGIKQKVRFRLTLNGLPRPVFRESPV